MLFILACIKCKDSDQNIFCLIFYLQLSKTVIYYKFGYNGSFHGMLHSFLLVSKLIDIIEIGPIYFQYSSLLIIIFFFAFLSYEGEPGKQVRSAIRIKNTSKSHVAFKVYIYGILMLPVL